MCVNKLTEQMGRNVPNVYSNEQFQINLTSLWIFLFIDFSYNSHTTGKLPGIIAHALIKYSP